MKDDQFNGLSDQFLSLVSGGTLNDDQKRLPDSMVSFYRNQFPETTLNDFLNIFRKSYPEFDMESYSEDLIAEIRGHVSHFWDWNSLSDFLYAPADRPVTS